MLDLPYYPSLTLMSLPQADTLDKKFEKPLRAELENYRLTVNVS